MSLLQTPVSLVDGIAEESLRFKESFAVVGIPLRSMRGTWTTFTICNYDEDRMHLRRLPETSLMQPVTEPTAASRLNSRPSACGFDARNAFTTAPADFAFGAVSSCPSFYRGEQYDSDLALYYLRARYYNPTTGRFLSEDPIGFAGSGTNLYSYAKSNPINFNDPTGMCNASPQSPLAKCLNAAGFETLIGVIGAVLGIGTLGAVQGAAAYAGLGWLGIMFYTGSGALLEAMAAGIGLLFIEAALLTLVILVATVATAFALCMKGIQP